MIIMELKEPLYEKDFLKHEHIIYIDTCNDCWYLDFYLFLSS